jgi:hypothetical protein
MKATDMWVCSQCHNVFHGDDHWEAGGCCTSCSKKKDVVPTESKTENWIRYLKELQDREPTYRQRMCPKHSYQKIPKSGLHLGIALWRCIHCEAVVQAS